MKVTLWYCGTPPMKILDAATDCDRLGLPTGDKPTDTKTLRPTMATISNETRWFCEASLS